MLGPSGSEALMSRDFYRKLGILRRFVRMAMVTTLACMFLISATPISSGATSQSRSITQAPGTSNTIRPQIHGTLNPADPRFTSSVPLLPHGAKKVAPLASSTQLNLDLALLPSQHEELNQLLQNIYDPASPEYHHYLSAAQFAQKFAPPSQIVAQVSSYLTQNVFRLDGFPLTHF